MYKIMKYLFDHPIKTGIIFSGGVFAFVAVVSILPEWALIILELLMVGFLIAIPIVDLYLTKKEKEKIENLTYEDLTVMYAEYDVLVKQQIKLQKYNKDFIRNKWLEDYHRNFYIASSMLDRTKFTDFHIAACMIFALVSKDDSLSHVHFVYDCVRNLISKPRVYIRHVGRGGMIRLEVESTWQEMDFSVIEKKISVDTICKTIKDVYIPNKNKCTLIELANFLQRLYYRSAEPTTENVLNNRTE